MGLLRSVTVTDGHARVELLLTSGWCPFAARVLTDVEDAIGAQPGVDTCEVEVVWDEAWTTDRLSASAAGKLRFLPDPVAVPDRDAYLAAHRPLAEEAAHDRRRVRLRRGRAPVQLHARRTPTAGRARCSPTTSTPSTRR